MRGMGGISKAVAHLLYAARISLIFMIMVSSLVNLSDKIDKIFPSASKPLASL
jgi:hypothetical protein